MSKQKRLNVSLTGLICLLLFSACLAFGQSKTRRAQSVPTKTRTAPSTRGGTSPAVVSRFIEALKKRDFKTVIDLNLNDQREIAGIKAANPRALWPRLINDYQERRITSLTEASSYWGDYGRSTMAMMGDPTNNLRTILYFLPPSCKWRVSEVRNQSKLSVIYDRYLETTVYVTVDYPLDDSTPLSGRNFLKQIMLEIPVYAANQSIMNVYTVKGTEVVWEKPYPTSATTFLVNKYKADVLAVDRDTIRNAIHELVELAGPEEAESYLLEVIEQPNHAYPSFDLALDYLAERHVKKAFPIALEALKDPNYEDKTDADCRKRNVLQALDRIGKTESSGEAVSVLKGRISLRYFPRANDSCSNLHLKTLASVEDNKEWLSFSYRSFSSILEEIGQNWASASVIDRDSPTINQTNALLQELQPCKKAGCPYRLLIFGSIKVIDAMNVQLRGDIMGGIPLYGSRKKQGTFEMTLKRKPEQPDEWLVEEITRQNQ